MSIAVQVAQLGKRYRLGQVRLPYHNLRDRVMQTLARPWQILRPEAAQADWLWALKDIAVEIAHGEVVGIIGRNGAGKSTLLKILSRITEPTTGQVTLHGRVGSLLEVGTGFHSELTGRENIYLNGAILGMRRREIMRHFDAIVAFAEVERFLDTPVKYYSSGLYMRLAFAVAAHLEPEILIVDEVLAVGDAQFQAKCLGKMQAVSQQGRTVLFVSHNMDAVRRLCQRVIWLDQGQVRRDSDVASGVAAYLSQSVREGGQAVFEPPRLFTNGLPASLHRVWLSDMQGEPGTQFSARSAIQVQLEWENSAPIYKPRIGFVLQTAEGLDVLTTADASAWAQEWLPPGRRISQCVIPGQLLNEGSYMIDIGIDSPVKGKGYDWSASRTGPIVRFEVEDDMTLPSKYYGQEGFRDARWAGVLLLNLPWTQHTLASTSTLNN